MINSKLCPFCKKENSCNINKAQSCWCKDVSIPSELVDLLPQQFKLKACICKECIKLFERNKQVFISKYL